MSHNVGRHRAPGRYNPAVELGQIVARAGTPLAKGSAVAAASGGLIAAIAIPAQAVGDEADPVSAAPQSTSAPRAASPATAVTAPAVDSAESVSDSFGELAVEPVAKPTGPTPWQLRMRAEREAEREREAAAERERREQAEQEQAEQERERAESAASRTQERQAPTRSGSDTSSSSGSDGPSSSSGASSSSSSSSSTSSSSPSGSTSSSSVIAIAKQYIGTPYVFGGASPSGFDCSGFTQYVFGKAGTSLPRVTTAQQAATTPVSDPQPGDLVFFGSPSWHVGIYLGNGMMIDAPRTGKNVSIRPVFDGVSGYGRV